MSRIERAWNWIRPQPANESVPLPRVWSRRRPINYPKQVEVAGGIGAPLLLGFSLTTMAQLVIGRDHPWLSDYAIALFAIAAALFVNTLQSTATALSFAATPSERLDFNPEAALQPAILRIVRERQWQEMDLRARYTSRAMDCYSYGLLVFLAGLGLILVPQQSWPWPWGRFVGVVVVGGALLVTGITTLSVGQRPRWLLPSGTTTTPDPLQFDGAEYLFPKTGSDEITQNLRRCVELLEQIASR